MKKEKIAEFIGMMLGDGSIGKYQTKAGKRIKIQYRVKLTLDSRNKDYILHCSKIMGEVLGIKPLIRYKKGENAVDILTFRKDRLLYTVKDIGLKFSPKWNNMQIPVGYDKGKISLLVLRGLFDTDGCLSVFNNNGKLYPRIEIRLCPSPAQEQINKILDNFNFIYRIQDVERGKTRIRISGLSELKRWFTLIGSSNPIHIKKSRIFLQKDL